MSSDVVIRAEGLGKKYMIGHQSGERYTSLRDIMAQSARNFARTAGDMFRGKAIIAGDEVEEFWALKDVNFEIKRGDVVGIIGRNGAGKSTLLKVLSRITEPSEGRVEIKGRVASLLEVGTGFHPELTGRENIYLNGAILGMSREEIKRKFDEIVDFSGVEKFLDTPVKRYSSGMYVRLAFAVAAHLEPEILIVDEVLAVGDAEFQKKCLGKMQDVSGQGRTVIFVSHNMSSIRQLCRSGVLLINGKSHVYSDVVTLLSTYANSVNLTRKVTDTRQLQNGSRFTISNSAGNIIRVRASDIPLRPNFALGVLVEDLANNQIFETCSLDSLASTRLSSTNVSFEFRLPFEGLRPGDYRVRLYSMLHNEQWLVTPDDGPEIIVTVPPITGTSEVYDGNRRPGFGPVIIWCAGPIAEGPAPSESS